MCVSVLWSVLVSAVPSMPRVGASSLPALLPDDFKCRILVFERAVDITVCLVRADHWALLSVPETLS